MRLLRFLVTGAVLSLATAAAAQLGENRASPVAPQTAAAPLQNDDVITMVGLGLSDDIVIAKIQSAPTTLFDTSIGGLRALKAGGVSNVIVRYMVDPRLRPDAPLLMPRPVRSPAVDTGDPDDPMWAHSPGVYLQEAGSDRAARLTRLDHINIQSRKTSGQLLSGLTYGIAPSHSRVAVDGARASVQTKDKKPTFYAYFPEDRNSFGGNPLNVRDLALIHFDTKEKTREVGTGHYSSLGSSVGTSDKARRGFTVEQIRPGIYKLTVEKALTAGQYAFQTANSTAFYDFGILATN